MGAQRIAFTADNLKSAADELGLDTETFNQCLDSGKHTQHVQEQTAIAGQLGVSSTPAFLINAQAILGAQPFENFQLVIDQLLEQ